MLRLRSSFSDDNLGASTKTGGTNGENAKKRLRVVPSMPLDLSMSLQALLAQALPDKETLLPQWVAALAEPSVSITSVEDVKRLDPEDIASLPVPPLVKGVFRDILQREENKTRESQAVLNFTKARQRDFLAPLRDRNMQAPVAGSKYFQDIKNYRLILTREEIEAGVRIIARRIETWCKGDRICLVGILKGVFMLMSDLCRELIRPYSVSFVEASSYKEERKQSDTVEVNSRSIDNTGQFVDKITGQPRKVVLVDELLDNGSTMYEMKQHLLKKLSATHTDKDILTVCLFSKKRERNWPEADITGITDLPDLWVVGYGLDDRGTKRGWPELFAIPKVKIVETIHVEEVEKLLGKLDENAILTESLAFEHLELPYIPHKRYRVAGLDSLGFTGGPVTNAQSPVIKKADIEKTLAQAPIVKGKYEHELRFAFIIENVKLVPEDDIFSGNNRVFSEMRMRLRKQITSSLRRFGMEGLEDIPH